MNAKDLKYTNHDKVEYIVTELILPDFKTYYKAKKKQDNMVLTK